MPPPPVGAAPPPLVGAHAAPIGAPGQRVLVGFLVTFQNEPAGSFWPLYSGQILIGRSSGDNAVDVALSDASTSSRHASIEGDPTTGYAYVVDQGSRNGTFLNEQRIGPSEKKQMRDGDRLRVGSTTFVVKLLVS